MSNVPINVFVTELEDFVIPDVIMERAKELHPKTNDRRTKAYKYLEKWAYSDSLAKKGMEKSEELRKDMESALLRDRVNG